MKRSVGSLLLAALLLPACVVHGSGYVSGPTAVVEVEEEPPAPRVVVVDTRPGFIWVEGRWYRSGGRWEWSNGHYERERAGQYWTQGHWERRGNRHVWIEGRWQAGAARREERHERREERREERRDHRDDGPVIRDHRH